MYKIGLVLTIFLSIYSPIVFSQVRLYQLWLWPFVVLLIFTYLPRLTLKLPAIEMSVIALLLGIFFSVFISLLSTRQISEFQIQASIGSIEVYAQIFAAYLLAKHFHPKIPQTMIEKSVVNYIIPPTCIAIIAFVWNPLITHQFISEYAFGMSDTGQWRFSGFFGLPYYAAIAYNLFIFLCVKELKHKQPKNSRLIFLVLLITILLLGGLLAASKTFIFGLPLILYFVAHNHGYSFFRNLWGALKSAVLLMVALVVAASAISVCLFESDKVFLLFESNIFNAIDALIFRYSDDNEAIAGILSDPNWSMINGVGLFANPVATDSQIRDVIYRFGLLGLIPMFFLVFHVLKRASGGYGIVFLMMLIGALGSNTLTPKNLSLLIWYLIFSSIISSAVYFNNHRSKLCL